MLPEESDDDQMVASRDRRGRPQAPDRPQGRPHFGRRGRDAPELGPNELQEKKGRGPLAIFLDQFKSLMIGVLIAAALISGFLKEWVDAVAILAIVILNAILGLVQEYRAEKSLAALRRLSAPSSKVLRDGAPRVIPARELVPGDLVEIEAGDNIPADSRVVWHTSNFGVQEASLTGESTPVSKTDIELEEKDVPLAERANILYLGTSVVSGKARAVVVETGMQTELGRIAGLIQGIKKETTPLQRKLEEFSKILVYLCFFLVAIVFGLVRGLDPAATYMFTDWDAAIERAEIRAAELIGTGLSVAARPIRKPSCCRTAFAADPRRACLDEAAT